MQRYSCVAGTCILLLFRLGRQADGFPSRPPLSSPCRSRPPADHAATRPALTMGPAPGLFPRKLPSGLGSWRVESVVDSEEPNSMFVFLFDDGSGQRTEFWKLCATHILNQSGCSIPSDSWRILSPLQQGKDGMPRLQPPLLWSWKQQRNYLCQSDWGRGRRNHSFSSARPSTHSVFEYATQQDERWKRRTRRTSTDASVH